MEELNAIFGGGM